MTREQQNGLVIAQDTLVFGQFLQKGVEAHVFALRLIPDAIGSGIGLPFQALLFGFGIRQDGTVFKLCLAADLLGKLFSFALVVDDLLLPLAADPAEDFFANLGRIIETTQPNVHEVDAIVAASARSQTVSIGG